MKAILVIVFLVLSGCAETIVINRLTPISESEPHSDVILCRKNNFYGYAAGTIFYLDGKSLFRSAAAKYTKFRISPGKHTVGLLGNGPAGPLASEKEFVAENGMAYYFYSNVDTVFQGTEDDVSECFDNETYDFLKIQ